MGTRERERAVLAACRANKCRAGDVQDLLEMFADERAAHKRTLDVLEALVRANENVGGRAGFAPDDQAAFVAARAHLREHGRKDA